MKDFERCSRISTTRSYTRHILSFSETEKRREPTGDVDAAIERSRAVPLARMLHLGEVVPLVDVGEVDRGVVERRALVAVASRHVDVVVRRAHAATRK